MTGRVYGLATLGLSRDEGMYVTAAQSYGNWLHLLVHEPSRAFDRGVRVGSEAFHLFEGSVRRAFDRGALDGGSGGGDGR